MAQMKNIEIAIKGRKYRILCIHPIFEMYIAEEVGRRFRTLISIDEVWA
jgi:hypothetical protein